MRTSSRSRPATERAYAHLRSAILDRTYPGSTLLTEGEVADAVGVSRTPVREALLQLQAEGLVRLYPKKGALVLPVSTAEAEDIFEARELVEVWAGTKAAAGGNGLADRLAARLARMGEARDAGDSRAFSEADRSFHEEIVAAAGNDVLVKLYGALRDRQLCIGEAVARVSPGRMDRAIGEHERILAALRTGDVEVFRDRIGRHVRDFASILWNRA